MWGCWRCLDQISQKTEKTLLYNDINEWWGKYCLVDWCANPKRVHCIGSHLWTHEITQPSFVGANIEDSTAEKERNNVKDTRTRQQNNPDRYANIWTVQEITMTSAIAINTQTLNWLHANTAWYILAQQSHKESELLRFQAKEILPPQRWCLFSIFPYIDYGFF